MQNLNQTPLEQSFKSELTDPEFTYDVSQSLSGLVNKVGFNARGDTLLAYDVDNQVFTCSPRTSAGYDHFRIYTAGRGFDHYAPVSTTITPKLSGTTFVYWGLDGNLHEMGTPWNILGDAAPCAIMYWNSAGLNTLNDERHSADRNRQWHNHMHFTVGPQYSSGLEMTFTPSSFSIAPGTFYDEDYPVILSNSLCLDKARCWYLRPDLEGMDFRSDLLTEPFARVGSGASSAYLAYDLSGVITPVTGYVTNFFYATNDLNCPLYMVMGQTDFATSAEALSSSTIDLINILPREWKLAYTSIIAASGETPLYIDNQDYRGSNASPAVGTPAVQSTGVEFIPYGFVTATDMQTSNQQIIDKVTVDSNSLSGLAQSNSDAHVYLSGSIDNISGFVSEEATRQVLLMSTGYLNGGLLSANGDPTKFNVTSGSGYIVDNYTDPLNPTMQLVEWTAKTAVPDDYLTENLTWIWIDSSGNVVQTNSTPTPEEFKDKIYLGLVYHNSGSISGASNRPRPAYNIQVADDFINAIGIVNIDGNIIKANGNNLSVDKSLGQFFKQGVNFAGNKKSQNILTSPAASPLTVTYSMRDGSGGFKRGSTTTTLDIGNYDTNTGTPVAVPNGKYTIQRIYVAAGSLALGYATYGQYYYNSIEEAIGSLNVDVPVIDPVLHEASLRALVITRQDVTALNDTIRCRIIGMGMFNEMGGSVGQVAGGDVTGPESACPNSLARFSGNSGKIIKDGVAAVCDDSGNLSSYSVTLNELSAYSSMAKMTSGRLTSAQVDVDYASPSLITSSLSGMASLSSGWSEAYQFVSENSAGFLAEDQLFGELSAGLVSVSGTVESLSGGWSNAESTLSNNSGSWSSAASTLGSTSGSWEAGINTLGSNSGSWADSTSVLGSNSGTWVAGNNTLGSNSGSWSDAASTLGSNSGSWSDATSILGSNSASWSAGTDTLSSSSAGWESTKSTVNSTSGTWQAASNTLGSNSASWSAGVNTLGSNSAGWSLAESTLSANSGSWASASSTLGSNSASWSNAASTLGSNSGSWVAGINTLGSNSASWSAGINTLGSNSASWSAGINTLGSNSGNWQSATETLSATSGTWNGMTPLSTTQSVSAALTAHTNDQTIHHTYAYAQIYVYNNSTTQNFNGTTPQKVVNITTNGQSLNATPDGTNSKITLTTTGVYRVSITAAIYCATNNTTFFGMAYLGGALVQPIASRTFMASSTAGRFTNFATEGIVNVSSVPVDLDFRAYHGTGGTVSMTFGEVSIVAQKIS